MLRVLHELPDGILELGATQLHRVLSGPTLIHLEGRRDPPLLVSVLLHGNEPVGYDAIRALLRDYDVGGGEQELPRSLSLLVGNVAAAARGLRHLEGGPDYNRIWPGAGIRGLPEAEALAEVVERMRRRGLFASIDIHNNTGTNPHYACVNRLESRFLHLATLFQRTVVYFLSPPGVQSMAFARLGPAVTLECGKVGDPHGVEHAREYIEACLRLSEIPDGPVAPHDIDVYRTVAVVKIPPHVSFAFGRNGVDLRLDDEVDRLNFRNCPAGTRLGTLAAGAQIDLIVEDDDGRDLRGQFFTVENQELLTRVPLIPSMLTRDENVIRQDCLCYIMERLGEEYR